VGGLPTERTIYAFASHPRVPKTFYASTKDSFFKSTDGGQIWAQLKTGFTASHIAAFVLHRDNPDLLFAGTEEGVILKSSDRGESWSRQN